MARSMASLQGALRLLPAYRNRSKGVKLPESMVWSLAMRAANGRAKAEIPNQAQACTYEQVRRAVQQTASLPVRVAMILTWSVCGRVGDILKLHRTDIIIPARGPATTGAQPIAVTFRRGKTCHTRGPYTVHTTICEEHLRLVQKWLGERRAWVFPREVKTGCVTTALRAVDPSLECRSMRRGSLQTLVMEAALRP